MVRRRTFLGGSLVASAGVGCAENDDPLVDEPVGCEALDEQGELIEELEILDGGVPFHEKVGEGWDARLYFDLSTLTRDELTAANDEFYIRTELPDLLDTSAPWEITVSGLVAETVLSLDDILPLVKPQGVHVLECSGNSDGGAFGLMSAAAWAGAPMEDVLALLSIDAAATRVLVSGFDEHSVPSSHSTPGAAWVFTFEELLERGAFLATEMNGVPLPPDHGAPVRLYVPGYYGCTCIKWVNEIALVDDDVAATSQMTEFASRTHQSGTPTLARDFRPAAMEQAAMPIRVEKRRFADGVAYRVVGIMWGGSAPTDALAISFDGGVGYERVSVCPAQASNQAFTLWEHVWRPAATGTALIRLAVDDPSVPTLRLDLGWYDRAVAIDEV